jgi:uncharacterized protein YciI
MLFALICVDRPQGLDLRLKTRPDHLAWIAGLGVAIKAAGPFTDDDGSPVGSLLIVEAENRAGAVAIAAADPYARAGLFAAVDIRPWKWLVKNPEAK